MSDTEQKPEEIQSLENMIFDFTNKEDFEPRLRIFVACIRNDKSGLPKSYYTDIIERIFAEAGYVKPTRPVDSKLHESVGLSPTQVTEKNVGNPVDGELRKEIRSKVFPALGGNWSQGQEDAIVDSMEQLFDADLQAAVKEAETRGVAWSIGVIDKQHSIEGSKTDADRLFKGVKNNLRDQYEAETGIDPAPHYPVNVKLTPKEQE